MKKPDLSDNFVAGRSLHSALRMERQISEFPWIEPAFWWICLFGGSENDAGNISYCTGP